MPTKKYGPPSTTTYPPFTLLDGSVQFLVIVIVPLCGFFTERLFFGKHSPIPHQRKEHPYEFEYHGTERLRLFERTIKPLLLVLIVCLEEGASMHESEHHEEETLS